MTSNKDAVITSVQRRRRWSTKEKVAIVQQTYAPGMSVSMVARRHGLAPSQVFRWRRLYTESPPPAAGVGEDVVLASEYQALQQEARELQRLLGKKTLENEILRNALEAAHPKKTIVSLPLAHRIGDDTHEIDVNNEAPKPAS